METALKGNATEAAVLDAFVSRDLSVLLPFGGNQPYDLVVDLGGTGFLRVQCKTARKVGQIQSSGPRLRLEPTRNNQKLGIRFAADYEIDRWSIESLRGLASHEGSGADQLAFA